MSERAVELLRALPARELAERRGAVRVLIITGLGLNCEAETEAAFRLSGADPRRVHLLDVLEGLPSGRLRDYQILAFIGGFAFGDHLGAGAVFANKIRFKLHDRLLAFIAGGGLGIGICNGFQTLVRLGLLPGGESSAPRASLAPNDRLGYRDAWVRLACDPRSRSVWTRGLAGLELPSRHGEGKFLTATPELLDTLATRGQIAMRYVDREGRPTLSWPDNPNGSAGAVAGICDPSGRVLGLMPHPDAYLYPMHHPQWATSNRDGMAPPAAQGLSIFQNGVDAAAAALGV